jgi:hypothetical protein
VRPAVRPAERFAAAEAVLRVVGPTSVLTALLYYFGWTRTHTFYAYFGIDADAIGLTPVDYFLRSADALWTPLVVVTVVVLLAGVVRRIAGLVSVNGRARRAGPALRIVLVLAGVALLVMTTVGILGHAFLGYLVVAPLCLIGGVLLLAAAWHVPGRQAASTRDDGVLRAVFWMLVVLACFWATAAFAEQLGTGRAAHQEAEHFAEFPDVILYSKNRLAVDPSGVREQVLAAGYVPYRYRYDGWKLMARSDDRMVLMPATWSTDNAYALLLPVGSDALVEFAPHF